MAGLERVDTVELSERIRKNTPVLASSSIFALWMFDKGGRLQRAQHLLKYGQRPAFGSSLGRALGLGWRAHASHLPDVVIPVPLHRTRQLERGYNQSAALAAGVGSALGLPVDGHALVRRAATRRQTGLTRAARKQNVSGKFFGVPDALPGKRVLLIDDVITTGATVGAAVEALQSTGVKAIDIAALAHART